MGSWRPRAVFTMNRLAVRSAVQSKVFFLRTKSSLSSYSYTLDRVKRFDNENYWASIAISNTRVRRQAIALRALNIELAQIADITSAEVAATGRLEFWQGIINLLFDEKESHTRNAYIANHPVVLELYHGLLACDRKLPKYLFSKLVKSRSITLKPFPFERISQLEEYADGFVCPIFLLIIQSLPYLSERPISLTAPVHSKLDHISGHLSKCIAITTVLRGIRHNAAKNRCYIPLEILVKHRMSQQELLRCQPSEKLHDVFFDLACIAKSHLDTTKTLFKDAQVHAFFDLFLPAIFCDIYLTRLQEANFDALSEKVTRKPAFLPLHFYLRSIRLSYLHY